MTDKNEGRGDIDPAVRARDIEEAMEILAGTGLSLPSATRDALIEYGDMVIDRSAVYNLISPADRSRFFSRHLTESLCRPLVEKAIRGGSLVDIGSGAGLPGLPLAILVPGLRTLLVEPRLRKVQFLEMAIFKLGLSDRVEVFQGTAEALGRKSRGSLGAGLATARAVSRIENIWAWSQDLIAPGGWLATYKAPADADEEAGSLGNPVPAMIETSPVPGAHRTLVLIQRPPAP